MAKQTLPIQSPIKGVNRLFARSEQPDRTCWDALNILPFDRYGRLRIAQRPGTSKLYAAALGGGTASVQGLWQCSWVLDPFSVVPDAVLFTESFTYANGVLNTLNPNWRASATNTSDRSGVTVGVDNTRVLVDTAKAKGLTSDFACAAVYTPVLALGTSYVIRCTATPGLSSLLDYGVNLACRVNVTTYATTHIWLNFNRHHIELFTGSGTSLAYYAFPGVLADAEYTLDLRVNGNVISGWVNGIKYVQATSTVGAGNGGVGFACRNIITGSGARVDDFIIYTATAPATLRQTDIVYAVGGSLYMGTNAEVPTLVTGGTTVLSTQICPQVAYHSGYLYLVDGLSIVMVNVSTRTVEAYAATVGTAPTDCTLACVYRGRLVLAAPRDMPQNLFFSRVGVTTDWDYAAVTSDAAFAGNASLAGRIGEPVICLMPAGDDLLLIGGDHNVWVVRGDPGFGGTIDQISDAIGILGPNAWCKAPDNTIYFIGTGGLYKMAPGSSTPEDISGDKYNQFFASLNRGACYIQMAWDRDNHGAYIFISPVNTGAAVHLWYDARTNGLWPLQFPNAHGPVSCLVYDGDSPTDRVLLLGGRAGLVQKMDNTVRKDDGSTISSYVVLGPFRPSSGDSILTGATFEFGELSAADLATPALWAVTATLRAGKTAYDVTEGTPTGKAAVTFSRDRRTKTLTQRLRGQWFSVELRNATADKYFSFDSGELEFEISAGKNRRQR